MLDKVKRSPSVSITSLAFTCARQIPTIPTPEPTSKQALLANNSGNDKTNSDRNRLDGQMEHLPEPQDKK
jgi:hypothetical protein